ncbi:MULTISPECIES: hypothetical protein [Streptomyces]|uniref:DUF5709 domain-containing protein n=1 Tax=Streptomyces sudanensis TaxID=436397 RepID=A0ABY4T866_9ACTN|nr:MULTISPECIES: hypothetical protein [Streptomyces]MCP9957435.1 hypothetical protein [Streptomyces sudanensis]MCP9986578.1 hypothetical protein [Streptomyces sudanensis]MCQ0002018.1 hypothetical protein [Streptomyces sudanensis]URN15138.1 hypothetical protein MW084_03350 [Streptomyces sudanensis]
MTVDPIDPETLAEQAREEGATGTAAPGEEVPEADAAEQHAELRQQSDEPLSRIDPGVANEADAVEQARVVALDEDDYRDGE